MGTEVEGSVERAWVAHREVVPTEKGVHTSAGSLYSEPMEGPLPQIRVACDRSPSMSGQSRQGV